MKIETTIPRPGVVMQALSSDDFPTRTGDILATRTARIIDVAAYQLDEAIRGQLIALGWTAPASTDPSPHALQARSLRMMAEAHRLMAESLRLSGLVDSASMQRKRAAECDQGADDVERVSKGKGNG